MLGYRLVYVITLVAVFIFYLAYSPWFSWYLLIVLLLLPPLDFALSLPGMLGRSVSLDAPQVLEMGASAKLVISSHGKTQFPIRHLYVKLYVIGDDFSMRCNRSVPASAGGLCEVDIDTSETGLTVFKVRRVYAVSLLGLFAMRVSSDAKVSALVLPPPVRPPDFVDIPRSFTLVPKPGGGFSEDHDMREYRPGDWVKNIHWKLSAKMDSLIVREPLVPLQESRLVHILQWDGAAGRNAALSQLRWVAGCLFEAGLRFHVKFGDKLLTEEVSCEAELYAFLRRVLDVGSVATPLAFPRNMRFSWVYKV